MLELYSWVTSRTAFTAHDSKTETQCQNYIVGSHNEQLTLYSIIRYKTQCQNYNSWVT